MSPVQETKQFLNDVMHVCPSLMYEVFPFIFLITVKFFYLKLEENREMEILNSNCVSKLKIIYLLSFLSLIIGIILLLFFYSISSKLKNHSEFFVTKKSNSYGIQLKHLVDKL